MASDAVHDTLAAWRESGADRIDPVRFRLIEAMARRAAGHGGDARRLLDDRLSALLSAYGDAVARAAAPQDAAGTAPRPRQSARGALAEVVDYIARQAPPPDAAPAPGAPVPRGTPRSTPCVEPKLIDYFRDTWTRVSASQQLQQSLERVPEHAGPLNSSHLVHRSLTLMREMSPAYFEQFLSYVDALTWLEQMNGSGTAPVKEAPRAGVVKKVVRTRTRK
ncbi:DUF2894 domain-containing protein [Cupriavidus sp. WKF15]|uniref:DUF2894 domain-containing protein n=1 Tax=Cupriavidus sp. WKF15 TaxID=3032282 RepID=UPI0023E2D267|nr:DUF2894 domain-containing protein [Cupriavidus sp. WKF15]WER48150.1 DUF2894 domain-containing protein [Cupriavidus sp. WKF15]